MITDQMLNKYKIGAQMNECLMYSGRSSNFRTRGVGWGGGLEWWGSGDCIDIHSVLCIYAFVESSSVKYNIDVGNVAC